MKSPVILRIFRDSKLLEIKQFDQDQIILGHDAEVQVDLNDSVISPIHCLIELRDSGYYVCDLGSAVGTRKNGEAILDAPISSGDFIEVGPFRIQFFVGVPRPTTGPKVVVAPGAAVAPPKEDRPVEVAVAKDKAPAPVEKFEKPNISDAVAVKSSIAGSFKKADSFRRKQRGHKTFAPASSYKSLDEVIKPTKGTVVEVLVAWQDRVLQTYHFKDQKTFSIGSSNADILVPFGVLVSTLPFLEVNSGCRVALNAEMKAKLVNQSQQSFSMDDLIPSSKSQKTSLGYSVRVESGELLCISIGQDLVKIYVRLVQQAPTPIATPWLDFSSGELASVIFSVIVALLVSFYVSMIKPPEIVEEDEMRMVQIVFESPATSKPVPATQAPPEVVTAPPTTRLQSPPTSLVVIKEANKTAAPKNQQAGDNNPGRAAELRANPDRTNRNKKFGGVREQGGAIKQSDKEASSAKTKDVKKIGLLGAFSGGGAQTNINQGSSGAGDLIGQADKKSGGVGSAETREGSGLGGRLKPVQGGSGTSTTGISGIGTVGKSSGQGTYGSGTGLGGKGSVNIDAGGDGEAWEGSIDREAVRRVIRSISSQIRSCYERQLRSDDSLRGKIVIKFEIVEQGRVRASRASSSSMNNSTVENCVAARIREARFPEPPAGTVAVIDFPFVFTKQE